MNAKTTANRLDTFLNTDNNQVAKVRAVNTRWIYVNDGVCGYYLDAWSVTEAKLADIEGEDGYSHFCTQTDAVKFDGLSARSKRDALATLGDQARNTSGW